MGLSESVHLVCDVMAHPKDLKFHWRFNSSDSSPASSPSSWSSVEFFSPQADFISNGTRSVLTFSPASIADYGTVLCFANNEVGRQRDACIFNIKPAGEFTCLGHNCLLALLQFVTAAKKEMLIGLIRKIGRLTVLLIGSKCPI